MYEMSQSLIEESYEKSLKLTEVPGLLSVNHIKLKEANQKKTIRVTNVHEYMEGQDVLSRLSNLEKEKQRKVKESVERKEKVQQKELFYRCKLQCYCVGECQAKSLKECPQCHSVLKSVCSKMACRTDGKKPTTILPSSAGSSSGLSKKRHYPDSESESDMSVVNGLSSDDSDDDLVSISESEDTDDEVDDSIKLLRLTWASAGVEHKEEDLIAKWYRVIYRKKKLILYVAKIKNRFLEDVDGPVCSMLMECLMPKTGSGNEIKATLTHLPPDISEFPLKDLIYGPLEVIP